MKQASEKCDECWVQWILLGISVVHLIVLGLLWSVAIAIVCFLPTKRFFDWGMNHVSQSTENEDTKPECDYG